MMIDKDFKPIINEFRSFFKDVNDSKKANVITIALERNNSYVFRKSFNVFADGVDDERNLDVVERFIKSCLWVVGGFKIYLHGSKTIYESIKNIYSKGGKRDFDVKFMEQVYEVPFEVIYCESINGVPLLNESSFSIGGHLNGKRIGFDAGGSDRKASAVVNGETIYSEEVVWFPKLSTDINYQLDEIYKAFKSMADKMGDVDAIGVSTAGVIIENQPKVSSIFYKIPMTDFEKVKNSYFICRDRLEKDLGHKIPIVVSNDGDVTALAGAQDLKVNSLLGLAMGTSEAVGYVNEKGNINGYLTELAFCPLDFNKNAPLDEWSGDRGVGCKYLSQDAVALLAAKAGIEIDPSLSPAEKLKFIQNLLKDGDCRVKPIYETIGYYLAHAIALYSEFYHIEHVLILGRVTSGEGGDIILKVAENTLKEKFPEYGNISFSMPSEYMRRVGQSIAAASLAETL